MLGFFFSKSHQVWGCRLTGGSGDCCPSTIEDHFANQINWMNKKAREGKKKRISDPRSYFESESSFVDLPGNKTIEWLCTFFPLLPETKSIVACLQHFFLSADVIWFNLLLFSLQLWDDLTFSVLLFYGWSISVTLICLTIVNAPSSFSSVDNKIKSPRKAVDAYSFWNWRSTKDNGLINAKKLIRKTIFFRLCYVGNLGNHLFNLFHVDCFFDQIKCHLVENDDTN